MNRKEAARYAKALKIIHRYELSVPLADEQRTLRIENNEYVLNKLISPASAFEYANRCISYLKFAQQLNGLRLTEDGKAAPKHDDKVPIRNDLVLGATPSIYRKVGFENAPLLYTRRHALKALTPKTNNRNVFRHTHGLTKKIMRQVPQLLEDPVLIYNSPGNADRLCVVLDQVDYDGYPIVAVLEPHSSTGVVAGMSIANSNFLVSVYGKDNLANQLRYRVPSSEVIYFDKEKSRGIERISGIQFPRDYSSLDSKTIIRIPRCIGKVHDAKYPDRHNEAQTYRDAMGATGLAAKCAQAQTASNALCDAGRETLRCANRDAR